MKDDLEADALKKIISVFILGVLLLSGCAGKNTAAADVACYPDYAGVPDFGALSGMESFTRASMGEVSVFSYRAPQETAVDFQALCAQYTAAAEELGNTPEVQTLADGQSISLLCGKELVYLTCRTQSYRDEDLTLFMVLVGTPAQFEAAQQSQN